jgi:hypothetical protein
MNQMNERNFNIGDTVSIFYQDKLLVKGIIHILGSIPVTKFYAKQYHNTLLDDYSYQNDIYEEAIVVIDDKNVENLVVLTLENNDYKFFVWNDLLNEKKKLSYMKISDFSKVSIMSDNVTLTEIKYQFK